METVTIPKEEYAELKNKVRLLKNMDVYKRLLEFENNIASGKKFYRKDLGF
ncbi:MAG: hypothetical protein HY393_03080 [Candidatus Diapherotrites archaeon]|nr:hypothetical protein [Candidatus Diapherotrites archaeon]